MAGQRMPCPHCGNGLAVEPAMAGRDVICPHCRQGFRMPPMARAVGSATAAEEPSPNPGLPQINATGSSSITGGSSVGRQHARRGKQEQDVTSYIAGAVAVAVVVLCAVVFAILSDNGEGDGKKDRRSRGGATGKPTDLVVVTAEQLNAAYENNEVKADQGFKGKVFCVTGTVSSIGKDILDTPYVTLDVGDPLSITHVQCMFAKKDEAKLAKLSPGDRVRIAGTGDGMLMNVLVRDCWFYE